MEYRNIVFDVKDGIGCITFNRPKALNALNGETLNELFHALEQIRENEEIRVLILTGAGEKAFVAGADITELATFGALEGKHFSALGQKAIDKLQELDIPTIAAVNGFALGGGCEIAVACDFIYACETAKFGLPEINLGLIPGFGGTQRLPRLIGKNRAKEMIFTGMMIDAQQAASMGLVNKVCPAASLLDETMKTAGVIASKGKVSLRAAKQTINTGMDVDLQNGCLVECNAFALCMASEDAREGTSAFLEKRKAAFKGKLKG